MLCACLAGWMSVRGHTVKQTAAGHCNLLWVVNTFLETVELMVHTRTTFRAVFKYLLCKKTKKG